MQRGLSRRQLALRAGVDPATVGRIEAGKRIGSLRMLATLATALEVDPELLGGLPDEKAS